MANNYYTRTTPDFIPFTKARSGEVDNELNAVVAGFDFLPTDQNALKRGRPTLFTAGGTGDVITITTGDSRVAYINGDEITWQQPADNTGAVTLNVDGVGAVQLQMGGQALLGGELIAGRFYIARYDAANTVFQFINPEVSATSAAAAAASAAAALVSQMAAESWAIEAEDVPVPVIYGGDGVTTFSSFHWAQKSMAATSGGLIQGTGVAVPSSGGPYDYDAQISFENANNLQTATLGWNGTDQFQLNSLAHGATFAVIGEDGAGTPRTALFIDPGRDSYMSYDGTPRVNTTSEGATITPIDTGGNVILGIDSLVAGFDTSLSFFDAGVLVYRIFHDENQSTIKHRLANAGDVFRIEEGNGVNIAAEFTPNAGQVLRQGGNEHFFTLDGGIRSRRQTGTSTAMSLADAAGTVEARFQSDAAGNTLVRNEVDGFGVTIQGRDAGSVLRNMIIADPTGGVASQLLDVNSGGWEIQRGGINYINTSTLQQVEIGASGTQFSVAINSRLTGLDAVAQSDTLLEYRLSGGGLEPFVRKGSDDGGLVFSSDDSIALCAGESGDTLILNQALTAEDAYIVADGQIIMYDSVQAGWANAAQWVLDDGVFTYNGQGTAGDQLIFNQQQGTGAMQWQIAGTTELALTQTSLSTERVRATATDDLSLSSTLHGFQVGLDSGPNVGIDGNEIMARNNGGIATLNLNIEGGTVSIGQTANNRLTLTDSGAAVFNIGTNQDYVWQENSVEFLRIDTSAEQMVFTNGLWDINVNGGSLLTVNTIEATAEIGIIVNSDETFVIEQNGTVRVQSDTTSDADNRLIEFANSSGTRRGLVGYDGTTTALELSNEILASFGLMQADDSGGTPENYIRWGDSLGVELYPDDNDAFIALQTVDVAQPGFSAGAEIRNATLGSLQPAGFNIIAIREQDTSLTVDENEMGAMLHRDTTTSITYTLPNDADIPFYSAFMVTNEGSSGTLTIAPAGGVTLRWFDGGGAAPPTGSRTIARGGVATIYKYINTEWWIWGTGVA